MDPVLGAVFLLIMLVLIALGVPIAFAMLATASAGLYLIGGVGKTEFAGDDRFTLNVGVGVRFMPLDWLAVHADFRDYIYDIDLLGTEKTSHNLEARIGLSFFF